MFEKYYLKPESIDHIRASWISKPIEGYVVWLAEHEYRPSTVKSRVPLLVEFGEFAKLHGVCSVDELPQQIEEFVTVRTRRSCEHQKLSEDRQLVFQREIRGPIAQMLRLAVPQWESQTKAKPRTPFASEVPSYFLYLKQERGLSAPTIKEYVNHLHHFEQYLLGLGLCTIRDLVPPVISGFITTRATKLSPQSMRPLCSALRSFFRYCCRQQVVERDFSAVVESPQAYRLAHLPRSISWGDLCKTLESVDRRYAGGRRDYALLLLMVTYGLRAREIAKLKLEDIDWRSERLTVSERKAGHCTAYPLSSQIGAALLDYLEQGRPQTSNRRVFQKIVAPPGPMTYAAIAACAGHYLKKAGIKVRRPGSHTLRHTCVQRLVDANFSLKHIGDYVGHRSSASTEIYSKVDIEKLRAVASETEEGIL